MHIYLFFIVLLYWIWKRCSAVEEMEIGRWRHEETVELRIEE
jgi:hypothetical protein